MALHAVEAKISGLDMRPQVSPAEQRDYKSLKATFTDRAETSTKHCPSTIVHNKLAPNIVLVP